MMLFLTMILPEIKLIRSEKIAISAENLSLAAFLYAMANDAVS